MLASLQLTIRHRPPVKVDLQRNQNDGPHFERAWGSKCTHIPQGNSCASPAQTNTGGAYPDLTPAFYPYCKKPSVWTGSLENRRHIQKGTIVQKIRQDLRRRFREERVSKIPRVLEEFSALDRLHVCPNLMPDDFTCYLGKSCLVFCHSKFEVEVRTEKQ